MSDVNFPLVVTDTETTQFQYGHRKSEWYYQSPYLIDIYGTPNPQTADFTNLHSFQVHMALALGQNICQSWSKSQYIKEYTVEKEL